MSDTPKRDLSAIGQEILFAARNELYMNLPYLDVVLCALEFKSGEEKTVYHDSGGLRLRPLSVFVHFTAPGLCDPADE